MLEFVLADLGIVSMGTINHIEVPEVFQKISVADPTHVVLEVIDGDTFRIEDDARVRLLGLDAPEKGSCFYAESREYAQELLTGEIVELRKDITARDIFGRLLRYAVLQNEDPEEDNLFVNDHLIRYGFALTNPVPPNNRHRDLFSSAEAEAKKYNRGLWGACDVPPKDTLKLRETDSEPENPGCNIKGNISEKGYGKTYLIPGCDNYKTVKIDPKKGERYFCTEEEAQTAGFRKATNCP